MDQEEKERYFEERDQTLEALERNMGDALNSLGDVSECLKDLRGEQLISIENLPEVDSLQKSVRNHQKMILELKHRVENFVFKVQE